MKGLLALAAGTALLASAALGAEVPPSDEDLVAQMVTELDRCAREKDLEKFLSYSLDDVVALGPGEPAVVGKQAVREWYRVFYASFDIDMRHKPLETASFGDVVITRGDSTGRMRSVRGGDSIEVNDKYLFVLKRQADGSLKVWRVMFNANAADPQNPR